MQEKRWKNVGLQIVLCMTVLFLCMIGSDKVQAATYTTINVTASEMKEDGAYAAIQAALDEAKENATADNPYKVVVASGTYDLSKCLHIYSNTWLYLDGVTLTQTSEDFNIIAVGESNDTKTGYYYKNITIEGGVLDENNYGHTILKIGHAKNFELRNCTLQNAVDGHLIETAGVNGLTVTGCTFKNQSITGTSDDDDDSVLRYEAIQIDILASAHFTGYTPEDLASKNIVIDNCTFTNVPRGVGSHTAVYNNPVDTISITNCTFMDCNSAAIQGLNWINCTISNNTITDCPRGVVIYAISENGTYLGSSLAEEGGNTSSLSTQYKTPASNQNIVITDNIISCSGSDPYVSSYVTQGIAIKGQTFTSATTVTNMYYGDSIPAGDYYVSGVTITGNAIKTTGYGIRLIDTKKAVIDNNTLSYVGTSKKDEYYGIYLWTSSTASSVSGNTIKDMTYYGIYVSNSSSVTNMKNNTITSAGVDGIRVALSSKVTAIDGNTISSPGGNGIYLYNSGKATTISNNTITSPSNSGIQVGTSSSATTIKGNTISKPTKHGIMVNNSSKATTISSNTVKSAKKDGIRIEKATVTTVSSNTVSSSTENGIYLYNKATVETLKSNTVSSAGTYGVHIGTNSNATDVKSNTVSSAKKYGIYVNASSKVTTISSNTVSSAKLNGIFIQDNAKVTTISSNKITSAGKYGIDVESAAVTTIKSNTISKAKTNGIFVYSSGKVTTISSNKISSPGKYGIGVDGGTATTIKSNTITSPTNHGIFVQNKGKISKITGNTIKSGKARGMSINSVACNLTISSNTISSCKGEALIYLNPNSTSYTITVKSNTLTGTSAVNGIYGTKCKVSIKGNTIKSANKAISLTSTVKGTVYKNNLSGNKVNKVTYASKDYSQLSKPNSVKAAKKSSTSVTISWKKVSNADGYYIYRSTSKDGTYEKIATVKSGGTVSYTNKSLKKGTTYYYKVAAYSKTNNGSVVIISSQSTAVSKKL